MMTRRYLVIFLGFVLVRTEECLHGSTSGNCSSTSLNDNGREPCDGIKCPEGQICQNNVIRCIKAPCPKMPGCVPLPDPCRNVQCKEGEYCKLHEVQCIRAPCPPIASCVPKLCENGEPLIVEYTGKPVVCGNGTGVTCPNSYDCTSSLGGDQKICCPRKQSECRLLKCIPCESEDPCLRHECKEGETCTAIKVQCIRAPCPPIPVCIHDCPLKDCVDNCDFYNYDELGCRTCECIEDPCLKHTCEEGQICKLEEVQCFRAPCPPIPTCVYNCPQIKCAIYCPYFKYDQNGCQTCECYNPCSTVKCTADTTCVAQEVICKRAPCLPVDIHQHRITQDLTAHTSKPPERPESMSMLAEDSEIGFQPTPVSSTDPKKQENSTKKEETSSKNHTNTNLVEEPKGRALNFTMGKHDTSNGLLNSSMHSDSDLSDVTINDDDNFDMDMGQPKILAPKTELRNISHVGICYQGGLTYENGDKLENGCDSICTCTNGTMNCTDRCAKPLIRRGKKIDDPLCFAQPTDDSCCSVLVCAGDTETEPIEYCSYKNKTYNRGDVHNEACSEICTCEAGGNMTCKPRCPPVSKPNDRCVEVPNTADSCCKKVLCDVTLEDNESDKEDEKVRKVLSAKYINSTTISLKLDPKIEVSESSVIVEISDDKVNWQKYKVLPGGYVIVKNNVRYLKLENSDDITNIQNFEGNPKDVTKDKSNLTGCQYKDKFFNIGEEYNDDCTALCICQPGGMKCLKLQCPTYFGVDILDPNCIEWETVPPNFVPSPPNCCPTSIKCKNNGSCDYEGKVYKNWEQLPVNVSGCEKRCYCEMGKIECQNACSPVTAHPPPNLACPPNMARIDHIPEDDCCKYWVCNTEDHDPVTDNNVAEKDTLHKNNTKTSKTPSKTMGPLAVYENDSADKTGDLGLSQKPKVTSQENPFYHKGNNTKNANNITPVKPDKSKNKKTSLFVTPAPNPISETSTSLPGHVHSEIEIHGNGNAEELLQFINQHPELSNYPSGSVLEIHNYPTSSKQPPNSISNSDKSNIHLVPYVIPENGENVHENLPPGFSLEHLLHEFHKNTLPSGQVPFPPNPNHNRPFMGQHNIPLPSRSNITHPGIGGGFPGPFPGYQQPDDDILVHTLEAIDSHTVRLAFMVPPVIVNLHGRVEVRYTNQKEDDDLESWMLQVFAPPNDLIATPSLEFDLQDLLPNTEYKIKITITLRDIHTTHSSRIYKIKTPRELITTTLPPMIPIQPDLAITDINSTWVTVVWKKFDENELRFIDGVQLRYREIDGKIYAATPLIHRAVTSYTLEKLKPNTKYEIGIFFIPFPGQLTELHAEHMLHFTTANEVDTYGFNVTLEISQIKSQSVEVSWNGVPYPEDKYVNIYRAIYQSDSGKEDESMFKIAKRDSPTKTIIMDLKPGTRYRLWLEVYLTNGKIKTSNVQDFITKPRSTPILGASTQQDKLARAEHLESKGDYYGPLVIVAILAAIAVMSTLVLLLILIRRHNQNKAAITPPSRVSQSAYDNPTYKVEIQQETMGL